MNRIASRFLSREIRTTPTEGHRTMSTGNIPMRFTKKPVTIEAIFYNGTAERATAIIDWILASGGTATYHCALGEHDDVRDCREAEHIVKIHTLEGDMDAPPGWWVIRGLQGEFYPCRTDIFADSYEPENVRPDKAEIYRSGGKWRYRIIAPNGRIVDAPAGQTYTTAFGAKRAARRGRPGIRVVTLRTVR